MLSALTQAQWLPSAAVLAQVFMMSSSVVAALEVALMGAASACAHLVSLLAVMQRYKAALVASVARAIRAGVALKAAIAAGSVVDAVADVVAVVAVDAVVAAADRPRLHHHHF